MLLSKSWAGWSRKTPLASDNSIIKLIIIIKNLIIKSYINKKISVAGRCITSLITKMQYRRILKSAQPK